MCIFIKLGDEKPKQLVKTKAMRSGNSFGISSNFVKMYQNVPGKLITER